MNIVSAFDGMGCGYLAAEMAGLPITTYTAFEVDKWAIKVANQKPIRQLGDITKWKEHQLPCDLLLAGPPCQGLSVAGAGGGFEHKQSKLFWTFVDVFMAVNPTYFLVENVVGSNANRDIISKEMGVEPVLVNSKEYTAQQRRRYYWTNLPFVPKYGTPQTFGDIRDYPTDLDPFWFTSTAMQKIAHSKFQIIKNDSIIRTLLASYYKRHNKLDMATIRSSGVWEPKEKWFRWLTPLECERLQGTPDHYTKHVSNTQRYKMLGNGWTIPVIANFLTSLT